MLVVVHKKGNTKPKMTVFEDPNILDRVLNENARSPIIPMDEEIISVGIGEVFIEKYKKQHGIKNHKIYTQKSKED